jgi:hypothetical protein
MEMDNKCSRGLVEKESEIDNWNGEGIDKKKFELSNMSDLAGFEG